MVLFAFIIIYYSMFVYLHFSSFSLLLFFSFPSLSSFFSCRLPCLPLRYPHAWSLLWNYWNMRTLEPTSFNRINRTKNACACVVIKIMWFDHHCDLWSNCESRILKSLAIWHSVNYRYIGKLNVWLLEQTSVLRLYWWYEQRFTSGIARVGPAIWA